MKNTKRQRALDRDARPGASDFARDGPLQAERPEREKVRLSLDISRELNSLLEELATATGVTKSDVLRRAITLMEVAIDAKRRGKKFGVTEKDQPLTTEIIWL